MKFLRETREGTSFIRLCDDEGGYHYTQNYYTQNNWIDDDRLLLARSREFYGWEKGAEVVLVDLKNETETLLIDDANKSIWSVIVYGENVYYMRGADLVHIDLTTGARRTVWQGEQHGATVDLPPQMPHITADGRYINVVTRPASYSSVKAWIIDVQTGESEMVVFPPFSPPFFLPNHIMICPTDKDCLYFCHEGTTQYISNRLWMWDKQKGSRLLVKQRIDEDCHLADCLGHECWCRDGKGLYYIKYPVFGKAPYGIAYVAKDVEAAVPDVRYSKYRYWHVCVSPDGKKLASDTIERESGVCVIDIETGEEKCLLHTGPDRSDPTHPHPCFSPSSRRLCFQDHREVNGKAEMVGVGIIDL